MTPSVDFVYWAFSAAAQSISAFVALLLAGYTIVNSSLEAARRQDDSLEEVNAALLKNHHRTLSALVWLTGLAIIGSLSVVYFNRPTAMIPMYFQVVVAVIDIAAIVSGLAFVVSVVDPARFRKVATTELRHTSPTVTAVAPVSDFFQSFISLERAVRDYVETKELAMPMSNVQRLTRTFRQMIEALRQNERIDSALYNDLLEINKYRNLVFHGHVSEVDSSMIDKARQAAARIQVLE